MKSCGLVSKKNLLLENGKYLGKNDKKNCTGKQWFSQVSRQVLLEIGKHFLMENINANITKTNKKFCQ